MSKNILDPAALTSLLPTLLPSSRTLSSPQAALAALLHTVLSALDFRLVGVDDDSTSHSYPNNVLPDNWAQHGPGNFTFRYKHDQSSLQFVVKAIKLGDRMVFNAIAVESNKTFSLDISAPDFTSPSFYPYDGSATEAPALVHGFISSNRITDLVSQFSLKIVQPLIPALRKEGYTETEDVPATSNSQAPQPSFPNQPPAAQPRIPRYNPDEDEFPLRVPSQRLPRNPLEIGRRDLDPISGNPFNPPSVFPGGSDDGMYVGPNHPIFGMRGGYGDVSRGPWGGDGFLPPMGAPPGARFDPIGPGIGGIQPFPGRGGVGGIRGPVRGIDPDNDEFMPPGPVYRRREGRG